MKWKIALSVAAAGLLGLSAAAPVAAKSPVEPAKRQCFWTRDVNNFASRNNQVVNIRVGVNDVYQLQMMGPCQDVDWNQRIAIRSRGGDYICTGLDAEIISHSPIGPQRCPVQSIRKLTPAEVAALPKGTRP